MKHIITLTTCTLALLLLGFSAGCDGSGDHPPLGRVEGTVTFDGKPLEDATVTFNPVAGGRPGSGRTDAEGNYELFYSRDAKGAMVGENSVAISSYREIIDENDEKEREIRWETIPARYNVFTELKVNVEGGSNTFDFELEPGGEIVQPQGY